MIMTHESFEPWAFANRRVRGSIPSADFAGRPTRGALRYVHDLRL